MAKQRTLSLQHSGKMRSLAPGTEPSMRKGSSKKYPLSLSEQLRQERELLFGNQEHEKAIQEVFELCKYNKAKMSKLLNINQHSIASITIPSSAPSLITLRRVGEAAVEFLVELKRKK